MTLNVELLRQVKQHILANPQRLVMHSTLVRQRKNDSTLDSDDSFISDGNTLEPFAECGAVGCIAGWACVLTGMSELGVMTPDIIPEVTMRNAARLLGLSYGGDALFLVSDWPIQFALPYREATSQKERAEIVGTVIDYCIEHPAEF